MSLALFKISEISDLSEYIKSKGLDILGIYTDVPIDDLDVMKPSDEGSLLLIVNYCVAAAFNSRNELSIEQANGCLIDQINDNIIYDLSMACYDRLATIRDVMTEKGYNVNTRTHPFIVSATGDVALEVIK